MDFSIYFFSSADENDPDERYRFILEVARELDRRGFVAIWTPERHFQEFGGSFPNPSVLSAALATATESIQLRAGSVVLPHHHPVRVVEEWALIDQLSGGRAGVCLATGWHKGDFVFFPDNYEPRRRVTFDGIETLRALWRGETLRMPGPGGELLDVRTFPRPVQPELPLWLVYTSNPQIWEQAGASDCGVLTLLDNWERLEANIGRYRDAREAAGLDRDGGTITVGLHTYVGTDDAEVWEKVREPVGRYLGSFIEQKGSHASTEQLTDEEKALLAESAAKTFFESRSLLGSVDKCSQIVSRLDELGVNEVASLIDFGLPFADVLEALPRLDELRERFAAPAVAAPGAGDVSWYYRR